MEPYPAPTDASFIEGKAEDKGFSFTWREIGGPATEAPANKGFGTVLLIDMAKQFAEAVKLDYLAEGLFYQLKTTLDKIEEKVFRVFREHPSQNPNTDKNTVVKNLRARSGITPRVLRCA